MRNMFFVAALLLALPIIASAQDEAPRVEIFGGYSYLRLDNATSPNERDLNGFNTSFTTNFNQWLGFTAEFSGHFGTTTVAGTTADLNTYFVAAGPRLAFRRFERFTPYVHVLAGMARLDMGTNSSSSSSTTTSISTSNSGIALIAGGGVDANVKSKIAVRLFQADYILTRFNNQTAATSLNQSNFRASTGVVVKLGEQ